MTIDQMREYCLSKKGTTEEMPFGDGLLTMKVLGKIFALIPLGVVPAQIVVKIEPKVGLELRASYESVQPAMRKNNIHWVTVISDATIPTKLLTSWIDNSYLLVTAKFTKAKKQELGNLE